MADKNPLTTWLLSRREVLNPHFTEFEWPSEIFPGLSDFATRISFRGKVFQGRGVDKDPLIALEKSVSESIERCVWDHLSLKFNGFAVSNSQMAQSHARLEALERFLLHTHLSSKISFEKIDQSESTLELFTIFKKYNPNDKIDFFKMSVNHPGSGIVCRIKSQDGLIFPGFSFSHSIDQSITRSFYESVTNFAWLKKNGVKEVNVKMPKHISHEFTKSLDPLLKEKNLSNSERIEVPDLECHIIDLTTIPEFASCPASAVGYQIKGIGVLQWL